MKPKPKNLILDLLLAYEPEPLDAQDAVAACALFGITPNNARVALARLAADDFIQSPSRGRYRLGPAATQLAGEVANWRNAEQGLTDWQGDWLVVHTGGLGRSQRRALRQRERALDLLGFREWQRGLFLRPNNLSQNVAQIRARLQALGLERQASVFLGQQWSQAEQVDLESLWDTQALNLRYQDLRAELEAWLSDCHALPPEQAATESFLLGGRAIRQVVFDPRLPGCMVDEQARHDFLLSVQRYDAAGRQIWQSVFESFRASAAA